MCAFVLGLPEHKVRVVAPDVGGGFGSKIFHYIEEALVIWASKQINRPIKWTSTRTEAFLTDAHGRDHETKAEMGFDVDGNIGHIFLLLVPRYRLICTALCYKGFIQHQKSILNWSARSRIRPP